MPELLNATGWEARPARLAAIVCTRDRAGLLRNALQGLADQTLDNASYEVIVVDDGSTDDTRAVAEAFAASSCVRLRYVYQRHSGLAAARNLGVFSTLAECVLFLDDDDTAAPRLLEEHVVMHRALPNDSIAVLGFTNLVSALAINPLMRFVTEEGAFLFSYRGLAPGDVLDFSYFWGGRVSCKRRFLLAHGVFNPVFHFGCEDIELGFRLSRHGLKVVFQPRASSSMCRAISFDEFCARVYRQGLSCFTFSRLHDDEAVQRWTGVTDALLAWPTLAHKYDAIIRSGRSLDELAARKIRQGLPLSTDEVEWLHLGYRRAFDASRIRGIVDAHDSAAPAAEERPLL